MSVMNTSNSKGGIPPPNSYSENPLLLTEDNSTQEWSSTKSALTSHTSEILYHSNVDVPGNKIDEVLVDYLRKRGYEIKCLNTSKNDSRSERGLEENGNFVDHSLKITSEQIKHNRLLVNGTTEYGQPNSNAIKASNSNLIDRNLGERIRIQDTSLEQYAKNIGLSTDACVENHILFHGLAQGDPQVYEAGYKLLMEWICNSLDMYKYELHAIAYPIFVHSFIELAMKGYMSQARSFLYKFSSDHTRLHIHEVQQLSLIYRLDQLALNEYAQLVLSTKFQIQLSLLSFELLQAFLRRQNLFLLLSMINERVNLVVTSHHPMLPLHQLEEIQVPRENGLPNLVHYTDSYGYKSPSTLAERVIRSDNPNDSEIAVSVTNGQYDTNYMIQSVGGVGSTIEDLNSIDVCWGVLPFSKHRIDEETSTLPTEAGSTLSKTNVLSSTPAPTQLNDLNKVSGSNNESKISSNVTSNTVDGSSRAGSGDNGVQRQEIIESTKRVDFAETIDSSNRNLGGSDSVRRGKRQKNNESIHLKDNEKNELETIGPPPDRKSPFLADILEKLVLREPVEMKSQIMEDLQFSVNVDRGNLPSAICFSIGNTSTHVNAMNLSTDATMVGASCEDGTFRVWRNDDQPLGTAIGSVCHGVTEALEGEEDETIAVLRGHSDAIFGSTFSPDDRFALTASSDSTIRLWSLAAKDTMAVYKSHAGFPVWDVCFGPYGYYFASCAMDRTARLWSTEHTNPLRIFSGHLSDVDCIQFHPNHNYLATGSNDKTTRLWDITSGKCVRVFGGHFNGVKCLAFSRNGRFLASSGDDEYINIWDLQGGKRLDTLIGHKGMVTSLDFSQESSILASSSMDGTVRLWDMKTLVSQQLASVKPTPKTHTFVTKVPMVDVTCFSGSPPSRFLLKTLRSRQTRIYSLKFTSRNLLLTGGVLSGYTCR